MTVTGTRRNAIYQYWDGVDTSGNRAGSAAMRRYAERIGATYIYEHNPRFVTDLGPYSPHYGAFKPIYDPRFDEFDHLLFADTDVFPVDGLVEDIFEQFTGQPEIQVGVCEEWQQPEMRKRFPGPIDHAKDERWVRMVESRWPVRMPRTLGGLPRVFNSGVVVYSREGRERARRKFVPFSQYVNMVRRAGLPAFYTCDQPYLHAMLEVAAMRWIVMDYRWNSSIHFTPGTTGPNRPVNDLRTNANLVHVQLRGADHFDAERLWTIVNKPVAGWGFVP
jgi:hypothetical protein